MLIHERLMIEKEVVPEVQLPIKNFVEFYPGLHQACQTFTFCEDRTEVLIKRATGTINYLTDEEATQYIETLIKLYSAAEELEQAATLIRMKKELGLTKEPEQMRL